MYQYDHSANIWNLGQYIYVTNLIADENYNRYSQIFKINSDTREIVNRIDLTGPQIDLACSGRGGYCLTFDQHILLTGEWRDYDNTRMRTFLMKLDKDLDLVWVNYFPDLFEYNAYGDAVAETPSGDILLYLSEGKSNSSNPWISHEAWTRVVKTDADGNILLNKVIPDTFKQAIGYGHLSRMDDGGYLLSTQISWANYQHPNPILGTFQNNALLHKIDEEANPIWSRLVSYSKFVLQEPTSIALPGGGGAVMWSRDTFGAPAEINANFMELNVIDSEGNILKRHGWYDNVLRNFYRIVAAANGDILGAGVYYTGLPSKGKGVLYRASQDGEILWERHFSDSIQRPWAPFMELFDLCELADGRIAATGVVFDTNAVGSLNPNIGVLVVGADGCLEPGCTGATQYTISAKEPVLTKPALPQMVFSPNPASDITFVTIPEMPGQKTSGYSLRAYDFQGRQVNETNWDGSGGPVQLDVGNWPSGAYQFLLWEGRSPVSSGKLIVQR
jgi:hypothetical protein